MEIGQSSFYRVKKVSPKFLHAETFAYVVLRITLNFL